MSNWSPIGFDLYRERFPATPPLVAAAPDISADFAREWAAANSPVHAPAGFTCVLVRGLFGSWIPRHFAVPLQRLRQAGLRAVIAHSRATGTIDDNAALLRADIDARLPEG